jgi:hypothetical protein
MKSEPWRGNPAARVRHLEAKLAQKRAELRALNAAYMRQRSVSEALERIEARQRNPHRRWVNTGPDYSPCTCIDCAAFVLRARYGLDNPPGPSAPPAP